MVKNPRDDAQHVDNRDNQMDNCLRNLVVLRRILEHFSSPELLRLSLVNKLWKNESRILLTSRGNFIANVRSHGDLPEMRQTEQVDTFISELKHMNPVPFSGISIDLFFAPDAHAPLVQGPDPLQDVILELPSLKTVSVRMQGYWYDNLASPALLLIRKLLQDCSGGLEELKLCVYGGRADFIEKVVQDVTFPRLKILKMRESRLGGSDEVVYENYTKAIMARAPNLKVLCGNWSIDLLLRVLEGSSVVPVYTDQVVAPHDEIPEEIVRKIRLANMNMVYTGPEFNFERFNRITPMVLQQSCTATLRYMRLDAVLALPVMSYGISLHNVKFLEIYIDYGHLERTEPRILSMVKGWDFTRVFPNLNQVHIDVSMRTTHPSPDHMNGIIEQVNASLKEPLPDRAANIKGLNLHQCDLSSRAAQFFVEMFPRIQSLEICANGTAAEEMFELIWKNWLDLKALKVRGYLLPTTGNLDSVFCGIFPEEVAELRLKDDEYLKKVNIVPVMPALSCMKNIRTLCIRHESLRDAFGDGDANFMFSKLTALLAFARQPALTVNLNILSPAVPPPMTHLEPYVSVTHKRI